MPTEPQPPPPDGWGSRLLQEVDTLDGLLTATQAARYVNVTKHVIYGWVGLGHLPVADVDERGVRRFDRRDVRAAERKTRQSPNSHRRISAA